MLNPKCHKTLTKTLVNRSSPSNQGSYQLDFPNFSPLRSGLTTSEHTKMVWEGKDRTPHPSERKPHKSKEQGHLAWEKPQRPTQCLGPQRHGQRLDTTETRMHDPSRRGTMGLNTDHGQAKTQVNRRLLKKRQRGSTPPAQEHKTHKLPLNTWTRAKEHTKLTTHEIEKRSHQAHKLPLKHIN
jgi:hypothetical protein